jgi:hypothetical protein
MSTLAEIEAAMPALTLEELKHLERLLNRLTRERANVTRPFTGREAIAWWRETEHLGVAEGGALAADIASARAEIRPPVSRWD